MALVVVMLDLVPNTAPMLEFTEEALPSDALLSARGRWLQFFSQYCKQIASLVQERLARHFGSYLQILDL